MSTFADAQRNVRYKLALLVISIGRVVTAAGVEITRRGAIMRRDNQELPK